MTGKGIKKREKDLEDNKSITRKIFTRNLLEQKRKDNMVRSVKVPL